MTIAYIAFCESIVAFHATRKAKRELITIAILKNFRRFQTFPLSCNFWNYHLLRNYSEFRTLEFILNFLPKIDFLKSVNN